jgi:lambda family phage portal protein
VYESERVGQTRGKAVVASVARLFNMQDRMMTEQLRLAVLNSLIFAALETPLDSQQIDAIFDAGEQAGQTPMQAYQASLDEWRVTMRGGAIIPLPPGTSMKPFAPTQQLTGLENFTTVALRSIAAGLNMPYELIFRDFSKTNYSSARAALLEAWRYFASVRQYMIDHWCSVVYDLWFEEAVQRGMIPDCTPDDYYPNQVAWTRCRWVFAGRGWVDPLKEARAADFRLKAKISTLADECGEQGRDWREQIEQDAREQAYQRRQYAELGLPWPPGQTPAPIAPDAQTAAADALDEGTIDAADMLAAA